MSQNYDHRPIAIAAPTEQKKRSRGKLFYIIFAALLGSAYNKIDESGFSFSNMLSSSKSTSSNAVASGKNVSKDSRSAKLQKASWEVKKSAPVKDVRLLISAAGAGYQGKVEDLVKAKYPINGSDAKGRTALMAAAYNAQNEICNILIVAGAEINAVDSSGYNAMDYAASRGAVRTVEILLYKGKIKDEKNYLEYAQIMQAVYSGKVNNLPNGNRKFSTVNRISIEGRFPLQVAVANGQKEVVNRLIAAGADVNMLTKQKQAPLHIAAINNNTAIISSLLKNNAKIDALDSAGNSAVMLAAKKKNKEAVSLLIDSGARVDISNSEGRNLVDEFMTHNPIEPKKEKSTAEPQQKKSPPIKEEKDFFDKIGGWMR